MKGLNVFLILILKAILSVRSIGTNSNESLYSKGSSKLIKLGKWSAKEEMKKESFGKEKNISRNSVMLDKLNSSTLHKNNVKGIVVNTIERSTKINLNKILEGKPRIAEIREKISATLNHGSYDRMTHFVPLKGSGGKPFNFQYLSESVKISQIILKHNCLHTSTFNSETEEFLCITFIFENQEIGKGETKEIKLELIYNQINLLGKSSQNSNAFISVDLGSKYPYSISYSVDIYLKNFDSNIQSQNRRTIIEENEVIYKGNDVKISSIYFKLNSRKTGRERISKFEIIKLDQIKTFNNTHIIPQIEEENKIHINIKDVKLEDSFQQFYIEFDNPFLIDLLDQFEIKEFNQNTYSLYNIQYLLSYIIIILTIFFMSRYIYLNDQDTFVQMKISEEVAYIKAKTTSFYEDSSQESIKCKQ